MKKLTSFILAFVLIAVPMSIETFATEPETNYDDLVMPCYTYIISITSALTKGSLGFVTCTSSANGVNSSTTFTITCSLQRYNGSAWDTYKTKSETFSGAGDHIVEKSWYAPAGYTYRTLTTITVKNSAGTVVETASLASKTLVK